MEDKLNHPKPFDSVYHVINPPVDNHDKAVAEQQLQGACCIGLRVGQMPTAFHRPVLRSASDSYLVTARNYNQDTRVLTPGQSRILAAPETRPGNGEDPESLELTRPEVANDSESPSDVRDPPKNDPPFQRMEYQDISASSQTTTLSRLPPTLIGNESSNHMTTWSTTDRANRRRRRNTF